MHTRAFGWGAAFLIAFTAAFLLLALMAGCGGKTQESEDPGVEETWAKAMQADEKITSEHTEIAIYYENTQYGSGQTMSMIIDRDGDDTHGQQLLFGQVVSEYIKVGDKAYVKEVESGTWAETAVVPSDDAVNDYASEFPELPSLADEREYRGEESIGGRQAEHFSFTLGPGPIIDMFPPVPPSDFSQNTGGEVDAWIDSQDHYLLRYELVIHDVLITDEIGNGDIRFVVNFGKINESIEIESPV